MRGVYKMNIELKELIYELESKGHKTVEDCLFENIKIGRDAGGKLKELVINEHIRY